MLKNYLKIAWRGIVKDRLFTILNLAGLATGLAGALLIWLWISDELQTDKYNARDEQLFQIMQNLEGENGIETTSGTAGPLANALAAELPEVAYASTVLPASWFSSSGVISSEKEVQFKAAGQFISKDYFEMFSVGFLSGNPTALFSDRNSVAISEELAIKLFQKVDNCIGKAIKWRQNEFNGTYTITGVFKNIPPNATDKYDLLFNFELFAEKRPGMKEWGNTDPNTYVLLRKGTNLEQFNNKIRNFMQSKEEETNKTLFAYRFSDIYLYGRFVNGVPSGGRITYVRIFSAIALFILLIACINFMNLSTAKAAKRIREAGIKKVMGATKRSLILQHLTASLIMSFLSLSVALALIYLLLPAYNELTGKDLGLHLNSSHLFAILAITLATGLLAGSYPALYIARFKPVSVLKGEIRSSPGEIFRRKGLVIFQFTLSAMAIVAVLVLYGQMAFIQSKDLGYHRDHLVNFPIPLEFNETGISAAQTFLHELEELPGVLSTGSYYHNLNGEHGEIGGFQWPGKDPAKDINFANLEIGPGFIETVGIDIVQGRSFSRGEQASREIVFNESAIKSMGLENRDPIGKTVTFWGQERQIVGIARDFNFETLYEPVTPCFFQVYPVMPNVLVRMQPGSERKTLDRLEKAYQKHYGGLAFDYRFLDDEYAALYVAEERVAVLSQYFGGLAILISCLGLFGLAAFTAQKRQKEIGIRKVIGASVSNIFLMLSKDFLLLVIIAMGVAFPVIWLIMDRWLDQFAYKTSMGITVYMIAGISILLITLITISFQTIRAAITDPVSCLRIE
jgi:ABC-type antimicrobial peptide transport system permease subunit